MIGPACRHGLHTCAACRSRADAGSPAVRAVPPVRPDGTPVATVLRALAVGIADGSPVRAYRSRKGRTVPGYTPVAPRITAAPGALPADAASAVHGALVVAGTYPVPVTLRDVRTTARFDAGSAAVARRIIRAATYLRPAQADALHTHVREATIRRA